MVRKRSVISVIFINFFIIISIFIPIGVITFNLKDYGVVKKQLHFSYSPLNISKLNSLNIESDVGNIDIEYVYPPLDYGIDINIYIDIAGKGLAKKTYSDIFNISFSHNQASVNLTLDLMPSIEQYEILSLIRSLEISVRVNAEAQLNITTMLEVGNVDAYVPFGVKLYNIEVNITKGNVSYEFLNCFIEGNINAFSTSGNIDLRIIDIQYSQGAKIDLCNSNGIINLIIIQYHALGANITGLGTTYNGEINVIYEDNSPNIGALFSFYNYTSGWGGIENYWSGFYDPEIIGDNGYVFTSFDYPAINNYNLSFYKANELGKYSVNLTSN
jgi:hypothetical protein